MNISFDSLKNMSIKQINNIEDSIHRLNFCVMQDRSRNNVKQNTAKEYKKTKSYISSTLNLIPASNFKLNWTKKENAIKDIETEKIFRDMGVEFL